MITEVEDRHDYKQHTVFHTSACVSHLAKHLDPVWIGVVPDGVSEGCHFNDAPEVVQSLQCDGDPERNDHYCFLLGVAPFEAECTV